MPDGRVLVAFDDGPLVASPTWTRLDDTDNLVRQIEISTGKQSEFDRTETGTAVVTINDTDGLFDPNNSGSPYFGNLNGKQILLQLRNPVTNTWFSRFRGLIDEYGYNIRPSQVVSDVQIACVDIFDYLAGIELLPGVHGTTPPAGSESTVFYEDGPVDDRIIALLADASVDSTRYVVFSGNVNVRETKYDPGDSLLVGLRDAADAETPVALANIYCDRFGRFVFHGRQARIDPDAVIAGGPVSTATWDFMRWKIGDGAAIAGDSTYAQIRPPFQYRVSRSKIVNAALITPRGVDRTTIPSLVYSDATSIAAFGVHSYNYADSINDGHKTNGDTANQDLIRSAEYLVENFKDPRVRIESLTVKALRSDDPRAAATWPVLCRSDISDVARVTVGYSGGVGIVAEDYYVEGWTQTIRPLNPDHDMVELSLNVSPETTHDPYNDTI